MAVALLYETHSTTTDNKLEIAIGWLPGEMSAEGRWQAQLLGKRYAGEAIDAVFVSDLRSPDSGSYRRAVCLAAGLAFRRAIGVDGAAWRGPGAEVADPMDVGAVASASTSVCKRLWDFPSVGTDGAVVRP